MLIPFQVRLNIPIDMDKYQVVFSFEYDCEPGYVGVLFDIVHSAGLCQEICKFWRRQQFPTVNSLKWLKEL